MIVGERALIAMAAGHKPDSSCWGAEGGHFRHSHEGAVSDDEAFDEPSENKGCRRPVFVASGKQVGH